MSELRKQHHFVPKSYLKGWVGPDGKLAVYRLAVSHANVPCWTRLPPSGLAWHEHLYTRTIGGEASDEFERWLADEIEGPAQVPLQRVRRGRTLSHDEWQRLARYVVGLSVRTPAALEEDMKRWERELPGILEDVTERAVRALEDTNRGRPVDLPEQHRDADLVRVRIKKEREPGSEEVRLRAETLAGRSLWLFGIRHTLEETFRRLPEHTWIALRAPKGIRWFTSDDPVVRLNYYGEGRYDFGGGWGRPGCEILCPLSPTTLLYTKVGETEPTPDLDRYTARLLQRFIAEHAHRSILAARPHENIAALRPRRVDRRLYAAERDTWEGWHADQSEAEAEFEPPVQDPSAP